MSGHSKWSTIKRKKATVDARRGKIFTRILKEVTVAARLGGGDPSANPRLRAAVLEAKSNNVPGDNIERAIKKGTGEIEGASYEEVTYEGYGPGGVAVLVEAMTDNRNRTVSELRHLFAKQGGNLGETGCVSWMFDKRGYVSIERTAMSEEEFMEIAVELGADDISVEDEVYEIFTSVEEFSRIREDLAEREVPLAVQELAMIPQSYVKLDAKRAAGMLRLMEILEDQEDVQHVWANFDVDETLLAAQSGQIG